MQKLYLELSQLKAELDRCLQCKTKPCMHACPVKCSPCDFIKYAKENNYVKAVEEILRQNPLGEVCGLVCPDKFCVKACLRKNVDVPVEIPKVQATIMQKARNATTENAEYNGKKIAVVGLGPAGIGAVAEALKNGFAVDAFEKETSVGGALNLIPVQRLPREVLAFEWQRLKQNRLLTVNLGVEIKDYSALCKQNYNAIIVSVGQQQRISMGICGEEFAVDYYEYLQNPQKYTSKGYVIIIGGGQVATDCALTALAQGAEKTEMLVRRALNNMRITTTERENLLNSGVNITTMTHPTKIEKINNSFIVHCIRTEFDENGKLNDIIGSETSLSGVDLVVKALGATGNQKLYENDKIIYAGDFITGSSTVVEAIASGKEAVRKIMQNF